MPRVMVRSISGLHAFVGVVCCLALLSLGLPPAWTGSWTTWLAPVLILGLAAVLLEFLEVPTPNSGTLSVSGVAHVAIILIAPAPWGALAVGGALLGHELVVHKPPLKLAFNVANHVLTVSLATFVVGLIGRPSDILTTGAVPQGYMGAALAGLIYYAVNVSLTALVVRLATGRRFFYVLRSNNRSTILPDLGAETLGVLLAVSWYAMPGWVFLLGVPTAVIARTLQIIRRLERETVEAVETLADAIDDRDPTTFHHSERVSQYALALASAMDLDEALVDLIGSASRVHDLGKMGVSNAVLLKAGPLDRDEADRMREHPDIGARILGRYGLYQAGVDLVRSHHERWDGGGYPRGLKGEQIPLGARIIAVADSFDAMASDRPYRPGLHPVLALEELRRGAGSQWDPVVVGHFLRLFSDPDANLPKTPAVARLRESWPRPLLVDAPTPMAEAS